MSQPSDILGAVGTLLDNVAAWFFCAVMSIYILPVVFDRITFYIPKRIQLSLRKEVYAISAVCSALDVFLWLGIVCAAYGGLFVFRRPLFVLTTTSVTAKTAWIIAALYLLFRIVRFDTAVKPGFYHVAYMRHIRPEALQAYQLFIEELDAMRLAEVDALLLTELPYMHRQAALRKRKELIMN